MNKLYLVQVSAKSMSFSNKLRAVFLLFLANACHSLFCPCLCNLGKANFVLVYVFNQGSVLHTLGRQEIKNLANTHTFQFQGPNKWRQLSNSFQPQRRKKETPKPRNREREIGSHLANPKSIIEENLLLQKCRYLYH